MKAYVASHLKNNNRRVVYDLIASVDGISRAEISRTTGISTPTVLKIVDFFIEKEIVLEMGEGDSLLGRKPQMLKFNPSAFYSIGMDILADTVKVGVVDLQGNIHYENTHSFVGSLEEMMVEKFAEYIDHVIQESKIPRSKILGAGVSIPGITDSHHYNIEYANVIGIIEKKNCAEMFNKLSRTIGMNVYIENDFNAAAVGEFSIRKLSKQDDMIYFAVGTGIGAGIILNGTLRHGKRYYAGEIAYTSFDSNYDTRKERMGWMETKFDFSQILKTLQNKVRFQSGEVFNQEIDKLAAYLAMCISNLSVVLDIDLLVLGGMVVKLLGEEFIGKIKVYLQKLCVIDIKCESQISEDPGLIGLASIVANKELDSIFTAM